MQKRVVTWVALIGIALAAVAAYWLQTKSSAGAAVVALPSSNSGAASGAAAGNASAPVGKSDNPAANKASAVPVEVIELKPTRVEEELQAVGTLQSNESVILRPEVAGRVQTIGFRDGQAVKKGQLLVALDASLNEAEVAQAQAELALAISNLKRTQDLASKNFVSGSAQEQAASNSQVLEAKLKLAQARLAKMRIVAPFDGIVGIRGVSIGDYVKDGADLVNVEDIRSLKVDFRLPERYLSQLKLNLPVTVVADALPTARYSGTIDAINPRIDANGRSLEVRARLSNIDGGLRPGMFVRVRVILGQRDQALLVPEESIVPLGEDFFVYIVQDSNARRQKVKLGMRRNAQVELLEGVQRGDRVVTAGIRIQRDGQAVRVVNVLVGANDSAANGAGAANGATNSAAIASPAPVKSAPQ